MLHISASNYLIWNKFTWIYRINLYFMTCQVYSQPYKWNENNRIQAKRQRESERKKNREESGKPTENPQNHNLHRFHLQIDRFFFTSFKFMCVHVFGLFIITWNREDSRLKEIMRRLHVHRKIWDNFWHTHTHTERYVANTIENLNQP